MKFPLIKKSTEDQSNILLTLTCFVVGACTLKFLLEGVSMTIAGKVIDFGHADALIYASLLTPVLGAHGYVHTRGKGFGRDYSDERKDGVDDPDCDK